MYTHTYTLQEGKQREREIKSEGKRKREGVKQRERETKSEGERKREMASERASTESLAARCKFRVDVLP